jgi:K+-transporting ATPase ATPase C chain
MGVVASIRPAIVFLIAMTVLTGVLYPAVVFGIGQVAFPYQANGSLIRAADGSVVGSEVIGQANASPRYFQPRPSAAGVDGYDASASGGSNLGPTNPTLIEAVNERAAAYRALNGLGADVLVPVDAVTASASGLDPHISPANAQLQVARVARERGLAPQQVAELVAQNTEERSLLIFGERRVNVLRLNLALDRLAP